MDSDLIHPDLDLLNCKRRISEQSKQDQERSLTTIESPLKSCPESETLDDLVRQLHMVFASDTVNVEYVNQLMMGYKSNPSDWRKYAKFDRFKYTRNLVDAGNGAFNIMVLCWGGGHGSAIHDHADSHCFMKVLAGALEEVRFKWPEESSPNEKNMQNGRCKKCNPVGQSQTRIDDCQVDDRRQKSSCHNNVQNDRNNNGRCESGNVGENVSIYDSKYGPDSNGMIESGRSRMNLNEVCYINDTMGLHRVENPSYTDGAVSLHLYCPPFDACRVFDARTGRATRAPVTFWSVGGSRRNRVIQDSRIPEDH